MITDCEYKSDLLGKSKLPKEISISYLAFWNFTVYKGIYNCHWQSHHYLFSSCLSLAKHFLLFCFIFTFLCSSGQWAKETCKRHNMSHPSTKDFSWDGTSECKLPSFSSAQNKDWGCLVSLLLYLLCLKSLCYFSGWHLCTVSLGANCNCLLAITVIVGNWVSSFSF